MYHRRIICLLLSAVLLAAPLLSAYANVYSVRVAGVTFNNDNGTSRQSILRNAYNKGGNFSKHSGSLQHYMNNGSDAVYVLLGDNIIGNIPADEVENVLPHIDCMDDVTITVSNFIGEEGDLIYYARASLSSPSFPTSTPVVTRAPSRSVTSSADSSSPDFYISPFLINLLMVFVILVIFLRFLIKNRANARSKSNPISDSKAGKSMKCETKTAARSVASILLSVFLWYVLYIALGAVFLLLLTYIPKLVNVVSFLDRLDHFDHLLFVLLMGIPAIIPGIMISLIMKDTSEKAHKYTISISIVIIALIVFFSFDLNLFEKIEGIIGLGSAFYIFGNLF